jgi:nitronate monooxygenase
VVSLVELLGIELPIVQAPMAGSQGVALAMAVSEAGGLGSLPCAMLDLSDVEAEVCAIRQGTDRPFNLNFFCHAQPAPEPEREAAWRATLAPFAVELGIDQDVTVSMPARRPFCTEAATLVETIRPPVVSFHFGLPEPMLFARVKATGAITMSSATTVEEAAWLEAHGIDVIVAQGAEAGGHRGMFLTDDLATQRSTAELVAAIATAVSLPVVAAGGIANAAGVATALARGAEGVQIGTAFLLCSEATTSPVHRAALRGLGETAITNVLTGRPARGVVNRAMRELGPIRDRVPAFPLAAAAMAPLRAKAEAAGLGDFSPLWSGTAPARFDGIGAGQATRALAGQLRHVPRV